MADLNLIENVDGIICPIDPQEAMECESCQ